MDILLLVSSMRMLCCPVVKLCLTLQPHWLQCTRLLCPSLTPRACSNSCPLESVSPSNHLILLFPPFLPALNLSQHCSFPMCQLFISGGQSIGASVSVLPMNIQGWLPLGWTDFISLLSKGLSTVFSGTTIQKHQFFDSQPSLWSNFHVHTWLLEKP